MAIVHKEVHALTGLKWVQSGLQITLKQPLLFVCLLSMMFSLVLALFMLPIIGPMTILVLMPFFWLVFILAGQKATLGEKVQLWELFKSLKWSFDQDPRLSNWLVLGLLYTAANLLIMWLAGIFGPDLQAINQAFEQARSSDNPSAMSNSVLAQAAFWRLGLAWPISLVFWHTPALLFWGKTPPIKALFLSTFVCWRNLGAFMVFTIGWICMGLVMMFISMTITQFIGPSVLTTMLLTMLILGLMSAFYASLYTSISDCLSFDVDSTTNTHQGPPAATL